VTNPLIARLEEAEGGVQPGIDIEGRALAAKFFPREWAEAEGLTGKRRSGRMANLTVRRALLELADGVDG
jgi:hypothetical protein